MSQSTLGEQSGVRAEWPPPHLLEGDAWTFLGLARTRRLRALLPEGKPLSILGWSPVVLQALRYSVACSLPTGREMAYSEIALTAVSSRTPRKLLPLALLVDQPIAHELGRGMGFPKARGDVLVYAADWSVRATAGEGRSLSAARGPGAFLLGVPAMWLATRRFEVSLPRLGSRTWFAFSGVRRLAPAVGLVSGPLCRWAGGGVFLPLGFAIQGFSFVVEEPAPA